MLLIRSSSPAFSSNTSGKVKFKVDGASPTGNVRRPVSLRTADYDYTLPEELIARYPAEQRDGSRMMVLHRAEQRIEHRMFADFPTFLREGDLVVLNDTRVIPARAFSDDGRIELLFLEPVNSAVGRQQSSDHAKAQRREGTEDANPLCVSAPSRDTHVWKCLVKPGRKMRLGALVHVGGVAGVVRGIEPQGERIIEFLEPVNLEKHGEIPLPPYFEVM